MKAMENQRALSPRWVRLLSYAVMAALAVASIWLIDRRAMIRMMEVEQAATAVETQP